MTLEGTIDDKMRNDRTLIERISLYIPVYRGYREKNLRRDEDRAVRTEVARTLEGTKTDLATMQMSTVGNTELMRDAERLRSKTDRYCVSVKKSVGGYSSFHTSVKITESDLDNLVAWDAKLIKDAVALREQAAEMTNSADCGETDLKASMKELERTVDRLLEDYNGREKVMRGFDEGGDTNVR